jgi:hypothetical protein
MPVRPIPGLALALLLTGPVMAEGPPAGEDLKATIALHGLPCDRVIASKRNGDSDYTATCKNGNRYHIFVDTAGRVVVKKL